MPANWTICSLLDDSALTSTCRFFTVPKMSPRESPSRPAACESSRRALWNDWPLPSKVSAAWLIAAPKGPCIDPAVGPSCTASLVSDSLTSSHSTGTAVRPSPMLAPSAISGPLVYAGVS